MRALAERIGEAGMASAAAQLNKKLNRQLQSESEHRQELFILPALDDTGMPFPPSPPLPLVHLMPAPGLACASVCSETGSESATLHVRTRLLLTRCPDPQPLLLPFLQTL